MDSSEPCFGDPSDGSAGGVAELLGSVQVVLSQEPANLLEECLGVDLTLAQEVDGSVDHDGDDDRQEQGVDVEERPTDVEDVA